MIDGELDIVPFIVEIQLPILHFWCNLTEAAESKKLSALLYKAIYFIYGKRKLNENG